jgi:cytochrome c553
MRLQKFFNSSQAIREKSMKRKTLLTLFAISSCSVLLNVTPAVAQGDAEAGKYAFATCSGCHAIPGYTNAYPTYHVPRLGGQRAEYIISALTAYKVGDRPHQTMHANAVNLSDENMADIAAFVSGFELGDDDVPVSGDTEAGQAKATACEACHGANLETPPPPTPPRLIGQFQDYLVQALKDYKSGARKNAIMNGMAAALSEEDMNDVAAYYSSQTPGLAVIDYSGRE